MKQHEVRRSIAQANSDDLRAALTVLLAVHGSPVFGAAKTVEHEVAALSALRILGYLPEDCDEYVLIEQLRVTRSKARSLLYQQALRSAEAAPEDELRALLTSPRLYRDASSGLFLIDVPSPLTLDRLKSRVRSLGHVSDGSFAAGVAKLPGEALSALVEDLIPKDARDAIYRTMVKKGLTDRSLRGVVVSVLTQSAMKVAGHAGEEFARATADSVRDAIAALFKGAVDLARLESVDD